MTNEVHPFPGKSGLAQTRALHRSLRWMRSGRPDLALPLLRQMERQDPEDPLIGLSLATALLRTGDAGEALESFDALLKTDPQNIRALHGRGICLQREGDVPAALDAFRKVVAASPLSWRAWQSIADITPHEDERVHAIEGAADALLVLCQEEKESSAPACDLASALLEARAPIRALQILDARPALLQRDPALIRLRARSLYHAGRHEAAFRESARLWRCLQHLPRHAARATRFDPTRATGVLIEMQDFLAAAGADSFLAAGTLLGFLRSGGPLPHDRDIDIGVLRKPEGGPDITALFRNMPGILLPRITRPGDRYLGLMYKGVAVDIFIHDRSGHHSTCGFSHVPGDIQWRFTDFGLRTASYGGRQWSVPADPDRYLAETYGPDWQTPDTGFASAVHSPALHQTSLHARAYYAVLRAVRALTTGDRARADALLTRSPVPLPPDTAQPTD